MTVLTLLKGEVNQVVCTWKLKVRVYIMCSGKYQRGHPQTAGFGKLQPGVLLAISTVRQIVHSFHCHHSKCATETHISEWSYSCNYPNCEAMLWVFFCFLAMVLVKYQSQYLTNSIPLQNPSSPLHVIPLSMACYCQMGLVGHSSRSRGSSVPNWGSDKGMMGKAST